MNVPYDDDFFSSEYTQTVLASARVVVPLVVALLAPRSVVDLGCGRGEWLHAFIENGTEIIRGFDGDYLDRLRLMIDARHFTAVDLTKPFTISADHDLAVCLEVAEHLSAKQGDNLVQALTDAAPAVLFSAAVPGQGGTVHINEQWPEYWSDLFGRFGFKMFDPFRPRIRDDARVAWWYRQNILLFARESVFATHPELAQFELGSSSGYGMGQR